jgi:hypothetical protein
VSGHPDFDGFCQRICPPPSLRKRHVLSRLRAALWLTRRQNALGCKPRILRARLSRGDHFMRMSDATPPGPQTSATCSTSLPKFSPAKSLRSVSGKVAKPATISSRDLSLPAAIQPACARQPPATRAPDRRSPRHTHIGQAPSGMPTAPPPSCPPKIGSKSATDRAKTHPEWIPSRR